FDELPFLPGLRLTVLSVERVEVINEPIRHRRREAWIVSVHTESHDICRTVHVHRDEAVQRSYAASEDVCRIATTYFQKAEQRGGVRRQLRVRTRIHILAAQNMLHQVATSQYLSVEFWGLADVAAKGNAELRGEAGKASGEPGGLGARFRNEG